jgi:hypothetical protein
MFWGSWEQGWGWAGLDLLNSSKILEKMLPLLDTVPCNDPLISVRHNNTTERDRVKYTGLSE